jgi:hypothetical protein
MELSAIEEMDSFRFVFIYLGVIAWAPIFDKRFAGP